MITESQQGNCSNVNKKRYEIFEKFFKLIKIIDEVVLRKQNLIFEVMLSKAMALNKRAIQEKVSKLEMFFPPIPLKASSVATSNAVSRAVQRQNN